MASRSNSTKTGSAPGRGCGPRHPVVKPPQRTGNRGRPTERGGRCRRPASPAPAGACL